MGDLLERLRGNWLKIVLLSAAAGILTYIVLLAKPNVYRTTAVIAPAVEEKRTNSTIGALASIGMEIGSPNRLEDLETLFKSKDLSVRVFGKHDLWSIVLGDRFNHATGKIRGRWTDLTEKGGRSPSEWDAIRTAEKRLTISINKRSGTLSVSFDAPSPEGSAKIVGYYLDEGKSRLQEEALGRAIMNKKFIEEQIAKTHDALTRDRLYSLYSQEVEREMMGRNREQFGFRIIDTPRVPDRKVHPGKVSAVIAAYCIVFFIGCVFFALRGNGRGRGTEVPR